eukprot:3350229-Prorocentrum_lima.AAC.1
MKLGALLEQGTILTVVKDTMEAGVSKHDLLKRTMIDELSEPALRDPHNLIGVASFVRLMPGWGG